MNIKLRLAGAVLIILPKVLFSQILPDSLLIPPNGIKLKDNVYIDKTEIANIHWLEYLHYMESDSSESLYNDAVPDTTIWDQFQGVNKEWKSQWYRYPSNRYMPVLGINHSQAKAYNKWRSVVVTKKFNENNAAILKKEGIRQVEFVYRLPSKEEWEQAASNFSRVAPYGYTSLPKTSKDYVIDKLGKKEVLNVLGDTLNWKEFKKDLKKAEELRIVDFIVQRDYPYFTTLQDMLPVDVRSGEANEFGAYHMIGNVAEMVTNLTLIKGGSWLHTLNESQISYNIPWNGTATAWVGFRSACEVYVHFVQGE